MPTYKDIDKIKQFIIDGLFNPDKEKAYGYDAIEILSEIEFTPTADVAEIVHGKWIKTKVCDAEGYYTAYKCSICGRICRDNNEPYCRCGAKMDGFDATYEIL